MYLIYITRPHFGIKVAQEDEVFMWPFFSFFFSLSHTSVTKLFLGLATKLAIPISVSKLILFYNIMCMGIKAE